MEDYCKSCENDGDIGFCDKCFYNHTLEERGIPPTKYKAKPKPITRGDQLRAMSDEELADWFETFAPSGTYQFWLNGKTWLQWLRQEAENERTD